MISGFDFQHATKPAPRPIMSLKEVIKRPFLVYAYSTQKYPLTIKCENVIDMKAKLCGKLHGILATKNWHDYRLQTLQHSQYINT